MFMTAPLQEKLLMPSQQRTGHVCRRHVLQAGGLAVGGLTLPELLQGRSRAAQPNARRHESSFGKAKSCIVLFMCGGPSHLDIWDLKPNAPSEIRGQFKPIATNVPGIAISEHLPRLARCADKYTIVRSVSHR